MSKVHDLINYERKKRGIPTAYWSREMAKLAQSQANYCAKVGRLVHSSRCAYRGGENLAQGGSNFSPRAIVNTWLSSRAGHREYLLSPRVRKMGVGIAKSRGRTYVAWAFSDQPPTYPDCPYYKPKRKSSVKTSPKGRREAPLTVGRLAQKAVVSVSLVAVTLIIFTAVALTISGYIQVRSGVAIASIGLILGVWDSRSLSLYKMSTSRLVMIIVLSTIFMIFSTAYLDMRSLGDIQESFIGALSIPID